MFTTLMVFQVLVAVGLISIVLVQRGPGATMGAAFGAGASGTVFGSRGAGNFLTRTTSWLAVGFFGISLALAVIATSLNSGAGESTLSGSVMEQQEQVQEPDAGAVIESAIEDLDNPPVDQQAAPAEESNDGQQAGEDAAPPEDEDSDLPEPPQGL